MTSQSGFQMDPDVHESVNKGREKKYAHHRILLYLFILKYILIADFEIGWPSEHFVAGKQTV